MDRKGSGAPRLKLWVPLALAAVIGFAYFFFYILSSLETQGTTAFTLANSVGLAVVFLGVVAAGLVLRRASPPS
jgi:hypothetical protein